ncbi:MAG: 2-oxo-hept-4-ene-1,7-dioate hydratase [Candidatus Moanabacter tarae]|uniref:2-oxo-hept-4-ene-1,7-dioate hydratase n=1 Tax=Candidatus Moanibacter tarae TaxID=2200854 RepID=A0A2Z4AQL8_9BACT|nr:MAG: 2-oxo-hept-4-ene-1,7-dioate hydratase [Candidatus Moanabacter tarae]|tara:strand:- start:12249 stop:13133 length:885 start_codon:yes stop_codon:yes gene_type:complete
MSIGYEQQIKILKCSFIKEIQKIRLGLSIVGLVLLTPLQSQEQAGVKSLIGAFQEGRLLPLISTSVPEITLHEAYQIQKKFVEGIRGESRVVGFKAGLTSKSARKRFQADEPLSGVLLETMDLSSRPDVILADHQRLMIETEIAFIVGKPIRRPISKLKYLKRRIKWIAPALELPELGFRNQKKLTLIDLVAANVSAVGFVVGERIAQQDVVLREVEVGLLKDGSLVNQGKGNEVMGDPWMAALWLANHALSKGWTLEPGMVLLTGAIGGLVLVEKGEYVGIFGELGEVRLQVR